MTNCGLVDLSRDGTSLSNRTHSQNDMFLYDSWIQVGGENFIWLPREFRSQISAVGDDLLALDSPREPSQPKPLEQVMRSGNLLSVSLKEA